MTFYISAPVSGSMAAYCANWPMYKMNPNTEYFTCTTHMPFMHHV